MRLICEWRQQRDIIDGTCVAGEGYSLSCEESKQAEAIVSKAMNAACDLAKSGSVPKPTRGAGDQSTHSRCLIPVTTTYFASGA